MEIDVSIIIPIFNGSQWIDNCFEHILMQTCIEQLNIEVCVCDDNSTDNTSNLLFKWKEQLLKKGIMLHICSNTSGKPGGVGYAKNKAVDISKGNYLCFQDVDDLMLPDRISEQYKAIRDLESDCIIGAKFRREPADSTVRYTTWANSLKTEQLMMQVYTANGPTVIMPTWFMHRTAFERVGGFSEKGKGTPEDLIFFYKHLDLGGKVYRVDQCLLVYNYHTLAATHSIHEDTIWSLRIKRLESREIANWTHFTIWNAGKQGRKFYKSLSPPNRRKVTAFCDVDRKKIGKCYTPYDEIKRVGDAPIKIVHFKEVEPPFIICVKMDLTNGQFEENLRSLHLQEGLDYIFFS